MDDDFLAGFLRKGGIPALLRTAAQQSSDAVEIVTPEHDVRSWDDIPRERHTYVPVRAALNVPGIAAALAASALIAEDEPAAARGNGIFFHYNGQQYFATAAHVVGDDPDGESIEHRIRGLDIVVQNGERFRHIPMADLTLVYGPRLALERGWPIGDLAIFSYDGEAPSVPLVSTPHPEEEEGVCVTRVQFPHLPRQRWFAEPVLNKKTYYLEPGDQRVVPALSFDTHWDWRDAGKELLATDGIEMYTAFFPGSSGSGIVNRKGELTAIIISSAKGMAGPEQGEALYHLRELL